MEQQQRLQKEYTRPSTKDDLTSVKIPMMILGTAKGNSGTGNRTLGSAVLISQVMRARNVSHYTIPDVMAC
ncbi:hypothetical protein DER45DRAFT_575071 [Fusarium avenaceum]|nr:hypothetical protein DER45DRAFT_575071 [Fusarium avenaceum]